MALLMVKPDDGGLERRQSGRDEMPALKRFTRFTKAVELGVETGVAERQEFFLDHMIVVDHYPPALAVVGLELDHGGGAVLRPLGRRHEGAGGIAEAKQDGIGPARERERLGVIAVGRDIVREEILTHGRRGAAARHVLRRLSDEVVAVAALGEPVVERVGVGREVEDVVEVVHREVVHHLLGEDGERGPDVAEISF